MDELGRFISTVGFPIAVTAYLLLRLDRTVNELKQAVYKLVDELRRQRGGDTRRP